MTAADGRSFEEHKQMIAEDKRWPHWPTLPLKRGEELAALQLYDTDWYWFRLGPMGIENGNQWQRKTLAEAQALIDDGWLVD